MTLSKQSIRSSTTILVNGQKESKEDLIAISSLWDEKQETFFRKMLRQGGSFKIDGTSFKITHALRIITSAQGKKEMR